MCCPRPPETLAQAVPSCEGTTLAQEAGPGRQHQAKQHCSGCSVSTAVTMWAKLRPSVQRRLCCTTTKEKSKRHFVNEILDKKCAEMDLKSGQAANRAGGGGARPADKQSHMQGPRPPDRHMHLSPAVFEEGAPTDRLPSAHLLRAFRTHWGPSPLTADPSPLTPALPSLQLCLVPSFPTGTVTGHAPVLLICFPSLSKF